MEKQKKIPKVKSNRVGKSLQPLNVKKDFAGNSRTAERPAADYTELNKYVGQAAVKWTSFSKL